MLAQHQWTKNMKLLNNRAGSQHGATVATYPSGKGGHRASMSLGTSVEGRVHGRLELAQILPLDPD